MSHGACSAEMRKGMLHHAPFGVTKRSIAWLLTGPIFGMVDVVGVRIVVSMRAIGRVTGVVKHIKHFASPFEGLPEHGSIA